MEPIYIQSVDRNNSEWLVSVEIGEDSSDSTTHDVSIDDEYYHYLTSGTHSIEELVEETFKFLLEREDKEIILRNFDLHQISNYFRDYEDVITERLMNL